MMKFPIINRLFPSYKWKVAAVIIGGVIVGGGALFMYMLRAHTYLGDDPAACVNCHIMTPYYATWFHSSHARNATCNDCHVPHENAVKKWTFKGMDGMKHVAAFLTKSEPQVIQAHEASSEVIMNNCIRCHTQLNTEFVKTGKIDYMMSQVGEGKACWDCHRDVPHGGLCVSALMERRAEVASIFNNRKNVIKGIEARNELFKNDFPREYQTWTETAKTDFESEFNGNIAVDALEKRPEMVILWAGYAFSKDYSTPRGHMHAIEDITASLRTGSPMSPTEGPQPSTCWTCKSPDVPRMMEALGVDSFYNNKWGAMGAEIVNPIGCSDCHDPETMNLHISRPALIEAFQRQGKDITKATPQEMRSLVCAQCHVEYYFKGDGKYLTFPWDKGFTVEDMEAYYDEAGFYDYIHKLSRTPILKAQHPDYEICQMGIHGQRGVSCADCHMPYKSEGGVKFSDHHIQSPLAMIDRTCQVCHRESEETLRNNVYERQRKANEIRNRLEQELAKAHIEAKFAWDKGATETQMKDVLALIRQAQWRWDFGVASHGGSFHAPQEIQRILSHGLDRAMQARLAVSKVLAKNGYTGDVPMPDISTKAKAQEYIGLDMDAERATKEKFLKTTVPAWLEKAKENGRLAQK